ncbi:MAG: glutathione S-transferase [Candidatus Azotimanducaceae bacterium]|jgi:glutathione S-transferase
MTYRLYQMADSGNCYKIRLLMSQLKLPLETVEIDITQGESRTKEFLAINPNGKVPTFEIAPGQYLAESNAILWYLARETSYLPRDAYAQALVMQWFGFEQYSHEPNIATARYWIKIMNAAVEHETELVTKRAAGYQALEVMEDHLGQNDFLVTDYSVADIALFAYTHVCDEGGFSLDDYPAIRQWIERVRDQSGFIDINA